MRLAPLGPQGEVGSPGPQRPADGGRGSSDVVEEVMRTVVEVITSEARGNGFLIEGCAVVTVEHLVGDSPQVDVKLWDGGTVPFRVEYTVESKDMAVLTPVREFECHELPLAGEPPRLGQPVMMVGYLPRLSSGARGLVSVPSHVINVDVDGITDFLLFGFTASGASGGPVVNGDGEVVGMARGRWAVDRDSEGEWIYVDYLVSTVDVERHLR